MKKEEQRIWVISLGGSRIVPDNVDEKFLVRFKKLIDSHPRKKFVVVTGGGTTARKYIGALRKLDKGPRAKAMAGIAVTRFHARFMARFFGKSANEDIPTNMKKIKDLLKKNQIIFCGGLRYRKNNTSDGTASLIAAYLKAPFINLTNIDGLYTSNPKDNPKAKQIPKITWKKFQSIASKIKFKAGQHFVLDQTAAKTIQKKKIPTYIVGSIAAINNILKGHKFRGTLIQG